MTLHADDVVSGVDHQNFASDTAAGIAQQEHRRVSNLVALDRPAKRRPLPDDPENIRESANSGRRQGLEVRLTVPR